MFLLSLFEQVLVLGVCLYELFMLDSEIETLLLVVVAVDFRLVEVIHHPLILLG